MSDQQARVLVVANRTAPSDELLAALYERLSRGPPRARRARAAARRRPAAGGLRIGSPDPLAAVLDATNFHDFDEIIVCTLPRRLSRWLHLCLPDRVRRVTGLPVTHVVADRVREPLAMAA
jgi:hypothetical protein